MLPIPHNFGYVLEQRYTWLHRINGANFQTGDGFPPSPKPWPEVLLLTAKEKSPEHHKTCGTAEGNDTGEPTVQKGVDED